MARSPISPATPGFRNKRLSVIAEDGSTVPQGRNHRGKPLSPAQSPPYTPTLQASHRPESRQWMDKPPHHSDDQSPPGYQHWNEDTPHSTRHRFVEKVLSNKQITRRGGWKRLLIMLILLIVLLIALAVGLGVGLSQHGGPGSDNSTSGSDSNSTTPGFPVGSYIINVYLLNISAACTSNPSTWRCQSADVYQSGNSADSATQYYWTISADNSNNQTKSFSISSISNPFTDLFANVPLNLVGQGTNEEHFEFEKTIVKKVIPSSVITPDGQQAFCYYNNTILRAELYTSANNTNMNISSPQSTNSGSNLGAMAPSGNWLTWPYPVIISEVAIGGNNVPNCYIDDQGNNGAPVANLTAESASTMCDCEYQNFNLPS